MKIMRVVQILECSLVKGGRMCTDVLAEMEDEQRKVVSLLSPEPAEEARILAQLRNKQKQGETQQ